MSLDEFDFLRRYSIRYIDSNVILAMVCVSILSGSFLFLVSDSNMLKKGKT